MGHIFGRASKVIVWLGEGNEATDQAIRRLKWAFSIFKLGLHFLFTRHFALRKFKKEKLDFQRLLAQKSEHEDAQSTLRGLEQVVDHNWFRRIWTIQEIVLAKKAAV
jgi:hypothetical protein